MKKLILILCFGLGNALIANANDCKINILTDDFSSSANWQSQGNGDVNVSNGKCNFDNVYCGSYNRVHRNLGATLSDNYWKAECDFTILNTNPSGYGTSEILMALTAGDLNFMTYDASQNYDETTQDGIAVIIQSASITDSNINNWYFCIQSKKGNIRTTSTPTQIYANSTINNYYIKLERISNNATQLGVFSDPAFTTHLSGSPVAFVIDATITGLNTVQHCTNCGAASARLINAAVDNDLICHNSNSGITEDLNKNTDLLIYPNPTIKNITIESPQQAGIEISDMQGQLIKKLEANSNKTIVDVSAFPCGLYVVKVKTEKGISFKKFVRE